MLLTSRRPLNAGRSPRGGRRPARRYRPEETTAGTHGDAGRHVAINSNYDFPPI